MQTTNGKTNILRTNLGGVIDALQISREKAIVSRATLGTQDQLGAAHGTVLLDQPDAAPNAQTEELDKNFDALATAASTEKEFLEELVR